MGTSAPRPTPAGAARSRVRLARGAVVPHSAAVRTTRPVPPPLPPKSLAGLRVLVVEDHDSTRADVVELLRAEGAVVTHARDRRHRAPRGAETQPEVLLLDLMLPDMDGTEVLRRLRTERPDTLRCVLILTGDAALREHEELERLGADATIEKPIDPAALLVRLRALRPSPA